MQPFNLRSYSIICFQKPTLGFTTGRADLTKWYAWRNVIRSYFTRYIMHNVADRDTPATQCTKVRPPLSWNAYNIDNLCLAHIKYISILVYFNLGNNYLKITLCLNCKIQITWITTIEYKTKQKVMQRKLLIK